MRINPAGACPSYDPELFVSQQKGETMGDTRANTSNRGFASMDAEKQRQIASKGGKAAHQKGTAHQFSSEEARIAGSKGGRAARQKRSQQAAAQSAAKEGGRDRLVLKQGDKDQHNESSSVNETGPRMVDPRNLESGQSGEVTRAPFGGSDRSNNNVITDDDNERDRVSNG